MSRHLRDASRLVLAVIGLVLAIGGSADAYLVPAADVTVGALLILMAFAWAQAEVLRYRSHLGSRHERKPDEEAEATEERPRSRRQRRK